MERVLFQPYNAYLVRTLGLDFSSIEQVYSRLGNAPGIYPDVGMLFERLAARDDISSIVEIGSGVSTLYWARAAQKYNKAFVSYEEGRHWLDMTKALLDQFNVECDVRLYDSAVPIPEADAVFLDGQDRLRIYEQQPLLIGRSRFALVDDAETPVTGAAFFRFFSSLGRFNFFAYDPTGRAYRVVMTNAADDEVRVSLWVNAWRPR